ncbi:hypothetical protein KKB71_00745 [Patescibacteria group bacterium]|nr:hypothetical protein [Patescibacteria group bacterium]
MQNKQSGIAPVAIIFIIIVVLVIAGGIWYYQIQEEMSNWQTYTNEEYGFEFRYPKEWDFGVIQISSKNAPLYLIRQRITYTGKLNEIPSVQIDIWDNPKNLFLGEWLVTGFLPKDTPNIINNYIGEKNIEALRIWKGGKSTWDKPGECFQSCPYLEVYFVYKDKAYCVSLNKLGPVKKLDGEHIENFNRILSTFKFSDREISPEITVLSPNGGENWVIGKQNIIAWHGGSGIGESISAVLINERNDIEGWIFSSGKPSSSLEWDTKTIALTRSGGGIKTIEPGKYKIRIMDDSGNLDESDNFFNIISEIDTSNWQTYRNEEYGFEVKYPDEWVNNIGPLPYVFLFGLSGYPNEQQFQIWVTSESNLDQFYEDKDKVCVKTTLVDKEVYKCGGLEKSFLYIEVKNKDRYYFISWKGGEFIRNSNLFDQILSTFKFY